MIFNLWFVVKVLLKNNNVYLIIGRWFLIYRSIYVIVNLEYVIVFFLNIWLFGCIMVKKLGRRDNDVWFRFSVVCNFNIIYFDG